MLLKPLVSGVFIVGLLASSAGAHEQGHTARDRRADLIVRPSVSMQSTSVAPIDTGNRGAVVQLFNDVYVPTTGVAANWTGSLSSCTAGVTSTAYKDATIRRVNYYRAMARLPGTVASDDALTPDYQKAALMTAANGGNHNPPPTSQCYSPEGAAVVTLNNLASGTAGAEAIARYIDDAGNDSVGHRRWVLFPRQQTTATGSVMGTGVTPSNVLKVIGDWGTRPPTPEFVAWPPPGFVPYQILPSASKLWSFSMPSADFSTATVVVTKGGVVVATSPVPLVAGFGDNTLVWRVAGISYGAPAQDESYDVTVANVTIAASPRSFSYRVTVIDPAVAVPAAPTNLRIVR
jgi:hypothetical protein